MKEKMLETESNLRNSNNQMIQQSKEIKINSSKRDND